MEVKQFRGRDLRYQVVEPDRYNPRVDYPMIIMIHGYASSMDDIARLSAPIDRAGYLYACPNAPIAFQVRSGRLAYGWSSPTSSRPEQFEAEEVKAAGKLNLFFEEVFEQYHVPPQRVLLMGFSQGGNLSLRCGLPRPETFAGLGSLSGYLPEPLALEKLLPQRRTQPVFVSHGTHDQYIPLEQAHETRDFLAARGYTPRYREYPYMRHEVAQPVIDDLALWVKEVLPPFSG